MTCKLKTDVAFTSWDVSGTMIMLHMMIDAHSLSASPNNAPHDDRCSLSVGLS